MALRDCPLAAAPLTHEEQRLGLAPVPGAEPLAGQVLQLSGLDRLVAGFRRELRAVTDSQQAAAVVDRHGAALWRAAVERAQASAGGLLDRYDDRPLYWARLAMTASVREWCWESGVAGAQRRALLRSLELTSRGVVCEDGGVLVSGFDPYDLDAEIWRSNPSGAAALRLHGMRVETDGGVADVRAVVLPVRWVDFDRGLVEEALGPRIRQASLIVTISQGERARMAIERYAGRWRGGAPDNDGVRSSGPIPPARSWPRLVPAPEWIESTLPHRAMIAAGTRPWPVVRNSSVLEWPCGSVREQDQIVCRRTGPTPGSAACKGGGGSYLSNEVMYRSSRLRLALGAFGVCCGHLQVSALAYPTDRGALQDAKFQAERMATVDQTVAMVKAAAAATPGWRR